MQSSERGFERPKYEVAILKEAQERTSDPSLCAEREALAIGDAVQRRVGYDLHDGLGQTLVAAALLARSIEQRAPAELKREFEHLLEMLNDAAGRVASIARGLAFVRLGERSFAEALTHIWEALPAPPTARFAVRVTGAVDELGEAAKVQLCLLAQEALRNALRHGHATNLEVELTVNGRELTLTVDDDGVGVASAERFGLGIQSMNYRARALGGVLSLEPRARGGTRVRCACVMP